MREAFLELDKVSSHLKVRGRIIERYEAEVLALKKP
jgi:hypothetical protein